MSPLFEAKDIVKRFGPTTALDGVSFSIYPGEVRGLIGENGSGKSTMSALIAGIRKPTSGTMLYKGHPWAPKSMIDALDTTGGVGICVQEKGTVGSISVAENIFLGEYSQFAGHNYFPSVYKEPIAFSDFFPLDLSGFDAAMAAYMSQTERLRSAGEYAFYEAKRKIAQTKKARARDRRSQRAQRHRGNHSKAEEASGNGQEERDVLLREEVAKTAAALTKAAFAKRIAFLRDNL